MSRLTRHLQEANESYTEHFCHAISFAGHLFVAALACAAHAILPFLFERSGSSRVTLLYDRMVVNRFKNKDQNQVPDGDLHHSGSVGS